MQREVFGRRLPRHDEHGLAAHTQEVTPDPFFDYGVPVPLESAAEGDVLHMWTFHRGKSLPIHCGVVCRPGLVLHTNELVGSVVVRYDKPNAPRIIGAYRLCNSL